MKCRITIDIDLPDDPEADNPQGALEQNVWDATLQHMICGHNEEALRWISQTLKDDISSRGRLHANKIVEYHQNWAKLLKESVWKFEKLPSWQDSCVPTPISLGDLEDFGDVDLKI